MNSTTDNREEKIIIREADEADIPPIKEIIKRIWGMGIDGALEERYGLIEGKSWQEWRVEKADNELKALMPYVWVTQVDGQVAGFISLKLDNAKKIGEVSINGVSPDFGKRGIGSRQLRFVLDFMRNKGMKIAIVSTGLNDGHLPARKMYEKAGFKELMRGITYSMELV